MENKTYFEGKSEFLTVVVRWPILGFAPHKKPGALFERKVSDLSFVFHGTYELQVWSIWPTSL